MSRVHLTDAQFRMLGRARRGERLPVARYRPEMPTVRALARKGLWIPTDVGWLPTPRGRDVYAAHGKSGKPGR